MESTMTYVHSAIAKSDDDDGENPMEKMSEMFGPGHVDQTVRSAIQACWMALPKERRNVEEVEKEVRRIMERALANFREDAASFGRAG
jgi:Asp-tRNA(Asn)/Glu-tRNA(Gln) amidotransferase A subunit family amidase